MEAAQLVLRAETETEVLVEIGVVVEAQFFLEVSSVELFLEVHLVELLEVVAAE